MKNNVTLLFLHFLALFIFKFPDSVNAQTLTPRPNISMTTNSNGYYEYLPVGYNSGNQTYPLLIFMEGLGEMGDGSSAQLGRLLDNGPLYYINTGSFPTSFTVNGQTSSFIIITPQYIQLPVTPDQVDNVITYAIQHYRVNTNKIYLTGLSMGGGQTFDYVGASSAYANRVAAVVPFASATEPSLSVVIPKARIIAGANLPVWAFHNLYDEVSDTITTNYIKYINQAPAPNPLAKATIPNATGHDCWSPAYYGSYTEGGLNIYQWMLQYQRNGTPPPPVNQSPTANAGGAQTITLPVSSVTLSGSGNDPDGSISSYNWTYVSGPSTYSITSPSQAQTSVTGLVQGSYIFQLKVTDNQGATATSNVTITVNAAPNQPPTANAGSAQTITLPASSVTLTGSGTDPDGTIASYRWSYISGPAQYTITSPNQNQTTVTGLIQGAYVFQLSVTDNSGASASSNVSITVNAAPNQPPVANAGSAQSITLPVSSVTLSGSGTDPDGTIASYKWSYVSGPAQYSITSPAQAQTTVTNLVQGSYVFQLTVTDNKGATASSNVTVNVTAAPNQSPNANAGQSQTVTLPANTVTLSGSGSDPDGSIASYKWNYVSGPAQYTIVSPNQAQTSVTNLAQGNYVFQLTVTDNVGAAATATVAVTVNAAPANKPPVANAGAPQTITLPTSTVTLSGSGSDPDGSVTAYKWTYVSGPSQYTIANPAQAQTTVTNLTQGSYAFQLTVTDNQGASTSANVNVTVNAAPVTNPGSTYASIPGKMEAESFASMSGVQTENTADAGGGLDVGYIDPNDWMDFNINVTKTATYSIDFRVASPAAGSQFDLRKADGSVLATIHVPNTGGYQSWQTVTATVTLTQGQQTIRIVSTSPQWNNWNINWLYFSAATSTPPPPVTSGTPIHIEAENYSNMSGIQTENTADAGGGLDVDYIDPNDWMDYGVSIPAAGTYNVSFRIAAPANNAQLQLRKADGTVLATVSLPNTGGYQTWQTVNATVTLPQGMQTLRIVSTGPQWNNWNINWIEFVAASITPAPVTGSSIHIEAETYASMYGVQNENTADAGGGLDVGYIDTGDWMNYSVSIPTAGTYTVSFRIATPANNAQLQLKNADGTVLTTVSLPNTGGYQTWQTVKAVVTLPQGQQTLRIISSGPQWNNWNFNWFDITAGNVAGINRNIYSGNAAASVSLYPNPVQSGTTLQVDNQVAGNMNIRIYDLGGKMVKEINTIKPQTGSLQKYLPLNELRNGSYLIRISMKEWTNVQRFIKID